MGFKDLEISTAYDSGNGDILSSFYIPVLSNSKSYYRVAEIFSGEYCKGWGNAECCMTKS